MLPAYTERMETSDFHPCPARRQSKTCLPVAVVRFLDFWAGFVAFRSDPMRCDAIRSGVCQSIFANWLRFVPGKVGKCQRAESQPGGGGGQTKTHGFSRLFCCISICIWTERDSPTNNYIPVYSTVVTGLKGR
ncbi:uncharacterized protein LOC123327362 [Drosophila simulans]|uniref:uncharacterized protein LOC123327362 n=1 Tax=Drosophila simulans TaxID=7240 RepID=UPI001D117DDE|nr:uncharacterized protein LOC123327362 [Drosophila simulans]